MIMLYIRGLSNRFIWVVVVVGRRPLQFGVNWILKIRNIGHMHGQNNNTTIKNKIIHTTHCDNSFFSGWNVWFKWNGFNGWRSIRPIIVFRIHDVVKIRVTKKNALSRNPCETIANEKWKIFDCFHIWRFY